MAGPILGLRMINFNICWGFQKTDFRFGACGWVGWSLLIVFCCFFFFRREGVFLISGTGSYS